jgi:hypothetical protein
MTTDHSMVELAHDLQVLVASSSWTCMPSRIEAGRCSMGLTCGG